MSRRHLVILFLAFAFIGLIVVTYIFIASGTPTSTQLSNQGIISLKEIAPGAYIEVEWRNRPVIIFLSNSQTGNELATLNGYVHGPSFDSKQSRVFVYERVSTYRGCGLVYRSQKEGSNVEGALWFGGWIDPCHFGSWDNAGRSYIRKPASDPSTQLPNLAIPKWRFITDREIELL